MSKTSQPSSGGEERSRIVPRATIHKQILDAAASRPDASLEAIADEISGASIDLVEQVLEEYGDPAGEPGDEGGGPKGEVAPGPGQARTNDGEDDMPAPTGVEADVDVGGGPVAASTDGGSHGSTSAVDPGADEGQGPAVDQSTSDDTDSVDPGDDEIDGGPPPIDPTSWDERQRETVLAIMEDPTATQAEIGDRLGVSPSTVCQRLKSIPGFSWGSRESFVASISREELVPESQSAVDEPLAAEILDRLDRLSERLEAIEGRLDDVGSVDDATGPERLTDPELGHKILHACLQSDLVSDEEELQIIKDLLGERAERDA